MADTQPALIAEETVGPGGRFLTLDLGGTSYGIQISEVREIIRPLDVTRVPLTPSILRGVITILLDLDQVLESTSCSR